MNTHMWRKLWAFLNQPLFEQNSAVIEIDRQLLEHCWNKPYVQSEYFHHPEVISVTNCMLQIIYLERCWQQPCIRSGYDR